MSFGVTGNCTIAASTVTITGAGSCTVTASQLGDANYNAASPVPQTFTILKAGQTITFGPLATKVYTDAPFTVSATASSGLAVSFSASGNCTVSGSTVTITGAGSCTITASQAGNANYNAAPSAPQPFTIDKATDVITFAPLPDVPYGTPPFPVTATTLSGVTPQYFASGSCTIPFNSKNTTNTNKPT